MRLSAFTPIGLLRLSGEMPEAKKIYRTLAAGLGGQFSLEKGSYHDAKFFATARAIARLRRRLRAAALQGIPRRVTGLLPLKELEKGIVPAPHATLAERRAELAARTLLPRGGTHSVIESALRTLLGDAFIAYRPTTVDEAVQLVQPLTYTFKRHDVARKIVRLEQSVSNPSGLPQSIEYSIVTSPNDPFAATSTNLVVGDVLVIEPNRLGRTEVVEVLAVDASPSRFTAEFDKTHDRLSYGFTHPMPTDATAKRHNLVVVTQECALDPVRRRQVNELMRRLVRDVSTWDIAAADGDFVQQFQIGVPSIGISQTTPYEI